MKEFNFNVVQFFKLHYTYCLFPVWKHLCLPPNYKNILLCYLVEALLFNILHLVYNPYENNFCVWCEVRLKIYFFPYEYPVNILGNSEAAEPWLLWELCSSNTPVRPNPHHRA